MSSINWLTNHNLPFVIGWYIMDDDVTEEEIIFNLERCNINGNVVKVNFAKAFDMVEWDFLLELLITLDFGPL